MGILEELTPRRNSQYEIEQFLAGLEKKERAEWEQVFKEIEKYTDATISAALKRRGVNANTNAVYRFRVKRGDRK
jgi:hypothetical protein